MALSMGRLKTTATRASSVARHHYIVRFNHLCLLYIKHFKVYLKCVEERIKGERNNHSSEEIVTITCFLPL